MRTLVLALAATVILAVPLYSQTTLPEPGETRAVFRDRDDTWSLAWSPDGRSIAFGRRPWVSNPPHTDIWVIAPDGSNPRRITGQVSGEHNLLPAWSPDGKRIAFAVRENRNWDLYLMNADGSGVTRLTEGPEDELYPQFLGDGTRIIYDRRGQLRVLDVATRESRVATIGPNDSRPAVSFDGNYVVYRSRKTGDFHHLWLMRAADALEGMVPDSKARQLTRGPDISDTTPVFSPDGTRIAFVRQTRTGGSWGPGEIWVMALK